MDITDKPWIKEDWKYADDKFIDRTSTLDELKEAKNSEMAAARFTAETAGITFNGVKIETDREGRGLITGTVVQAYIDPAYLLQWKTSTWFIQLTAERLKAVGTVVLKHVQDCFDKEAELLIKRLRRRRTKKSWQRLVGETPPFGAVFLIKKIDRLLLYPPLVHNRTINKKKGG